MQNNAPLNLDQSGLCHFKSALSKPELLELSRIFEARQSLKIGERVPWCELKALLHESGALHCAARQFLGAAHVSPVKAVLFDKTASQHWAVGWHQDRILTARKKLSLAGYKNWNFKARAWYVEPPVEVLQQVVSVRAFLDDCRIGNGPIVAAAGSHKFGLVKSSAAADMASKCRKVELIAKAGDVWAIAGLTLHASGRNTANCRRRLLMVDFSSAKLPKSLCWPSVD